MNRAINRFAVNATRIPSKVKNVEASVPAAAPTVTIEESVDGAVNGAVEQTIDVVELQCEQEHGMETPTTAVFVISSDPKSNPVKVKHELPLLGLLRRMWLRTGAELFTSYQSRNQVGGVA
jgi:hypothetical protein